MYKFENNADNIAYNKYITHLTKDEILDGANLYEKISRRIFSLQVYLGSKQLNPDLMGKLEFEMDMGVDDWVIGLTPYKQLSFMIANDSASLDAGLRTGETVRPIIGLEVLDGENKQRTLNVPYGTYLVDSIAKNMSVKTYHCYDRLYYMQDTECNFGTEVYSSSTTVGYILNKLTKKYDDIVTLSDSHKGDFAPYWDHVLRKPIKYVDYVAPPEEKPKEDLPEFGGETIEDKFPTDDGNPPPNNPGACCDCDHTNKEDEPVQNGVVLSLVKAKELLFADRVHEGVVKCSIGEDIVSEISQLENQNYLRIKYRLTSDDPTVISIESQPQWTTTSLTSDGFLRDIKVRDSGTATLKLTAELWESMSSERLVKSLGETTLKVTTPEVTKKTLIKTYWEGSETYSSDLSYNWDINIRGGGCYYNDIALCTENIFVCGTGTSMETETFSGDPDGVYFKIADNNTNIFFNINPCEAFNARYAVVELEYVHPRLEEYVEGICVPSNSTSLEFYPSVATVNDLDERGKGHVVSGIYADDGKTICIPNFFVDSSSYETKFQTISTLSNGCIGLVYKSINQSDSINQQTSLINSVFSGGVIYKFKVTYYGKRDLKLNEYLYLTDCFPPAQLISTYVNYGMSCKEYPHVKGSAYIAYANIYNDGSEYDRFDDILCHHADCPCNKWFTSEFHYAHRNNNFAPNLASTYRIIDPTTGKFLPFEESIWYKYEPEVYFSDSDADDSDVGLPPEDNGDSDAGLPPVEATSFSLIDRSSDLSSPSYDKQGNLVATYNTRNTNGKDPYTTPNKNNQVRSTEDEIIGFEMKEGQLLGYIAAYCGGNIMLDHNNELRLLTLNKGTDDQGKLSYNKHIPLSQVGVPEIHNCEASSQLGGMTVRISTFEDDDIKFGSMNPSESQYVMDLDNPFMTQERASAIFNEMRAIKYHPMRVTILSDPRLWLGDLLHFDTFKQFNETSRVNVEVIREGLYPIMKLVSNFDGAPSLEIEATSSNQSDRTNSFSGTLNDKINNVDKKVNEVSKTVSEASSQIDELRTLVAYINDLFAIEVTADNIVTATVNTRNIRIAPTSKDNGGVYIDGDSIDFLDRDGTQRLHIGSSGDAKDYYIRFLNKNGYTRELRALDPNGGCGDANGDSDSSQAPETNINDTIASLEARIAELENKLNGSEGE